MPVRTVLLPIAGFAALLVGCDSARSVAVSPAAMEAPTSVNARRASSPQFATLIALPTLSGRTSEALAVNDAGTVIAGYAWERRGTMRAVRWTLAPDGSWTIHALPHAATATGAIARAVGGETVAGNDFPANMPHVLSWNASGAFTVLGCNDLGEGNGINANGQVVVGVQRSAQPATAAVWRPGNCREDLPLLGGTGSSRADAVNGDGTIVGGMGNPGTGSDGLPVRWTLINGAWQVQALDQRNGDVRGANAAGDLAGSVMTACGQANGCRRASVWYVAGGSRELGTLGGAESWSRDINAAGDVVGLSATSSGVNTGYFWSQSTGMVQLPASGKFSAANAISGVRADGSRIVVGMTAAGTALAWVLHP
jgi:uncharacterized membrane protein